MRLYRYATASGADAGVLAGDRLIPIRELAPELAPTEAGDLDEVVQGGRLPALAAAAGGTGAAGGLLLEEVNLLAPLVRPPKIWCIGLNYRAHAADLDAKTTATPVGFMRPNASIIGPGAEIRLPRASERVTGEGELVIVLGRSGQDIAPGDALAAVGAYTLAVDMTAEDILRQNPRFLTRAKSFDTFLSLGPCLVTPDEVATRESLPAVRTSTLLNGERARSALVDAMTHPPEKLISFFSEDMTWKAGDILLTGTPGAMVIEDGDTVGAEVEAIGRLENPVRRLG
ncbi:MAG: fumarylacetoacetate hydrolase family protein [Acidobacteria bacterium]|nr:fumarylacetoacetate hydrolase family protein [Acidobacteriota bacterium]